MKLFVSSVVAVLGAVHGAGPRTTRGSKWGAHTSRWFRTPVKGAPAPWRGSSNRFAM